MDYADPDHGDLHDILAACKEASSKPFDVLNEEVADEISDEKGSASEAPIKNATVRPTSETGLDRKPSLASALEGEHQVLPEIVAIPV